MSNNNTNFNRLHLPSPFSYQEDRIAKLEREKRSVEDMNKKTERELNDLSELADKYHSVFEQLFEAFNDAKEELANAVGFTDAPLNELSKECYENSKAKGWYENEDADNVVTKLCLVHSEISEALEEYRNGKGLDEIYYNPDKPDKPEGFVVELADAMIRIFDICGRNNLDIDGAVRLKMAYNKTRPHRHGGKKC